MEYPKEFFKLQFRFADKVSTILGISFEEALLNYTCVPARIGIKYSELNIENPKWKEGFSQFSNPTKFLIAYELNLKTTIESPKQQIHYGCFAYDFLPEERRVRLHFGNHDKENPDILGDASVDKRLVELKEMFSAIKKEHPDVVEVESASWLYNVLKFRRLFPEEFFANQEIKWEFGSLGIWGQYIDKFGQIKPDKVEELFANLENAKNFEDIKAAIALKKLKCCASIDYFYEKYEVE